MIFLAIIVMLLFVPIAIGLGLFIIAPDWSQENRQTIIISIGIVDFLLFAAVILLFFAI
ncbi:hypothetical protein [Sphingorhabdus sp. EL138]|jgi:hypothetical protein|uniref:hypothetical protein n=1 Tax=Sphingorhabdus sp. EL138 TaxID=2073156 RepID=UPI0013A55A7B|nr:hypothetical protein [Sphingorhabdus sp. EL138]